MTTQQSMKGERCSQRPPPQTPALPLQKCGCSSEFWSAEPEGETHCNHLLTVEKNHPFSFYTSAWLSWSSYKPKTWNRRWKTPATHTAHPAGLLFSLCTCSHTTRQRLFASYRHDVKIIIIKSWNCNVKLWNSTRCRFDGMLCHYWPQSSVYKWPPLWFFHCLRSVSASQTGREKVQQKKYTGAF